MLGESLTGVETYQAMVEADWNPVNQGLLVQPDWDAQSAVSSPQLMPSSPGQWSQVSTPTKRAS